MSLTGQIGLVHSAGAFSPWLIRLVTRSHYSHVVIAISNTHCVSAEPEGARPRPISDYTDVVWSQFELNSRERAAIFRFAISHIGTPYSWRDFFYAGIAALLKSWTPQFIRDAAADRTRLICSQMAWDALLYAGIDPFDEDRPIGGATPGTFGRYFQAHGWTDTP